MTARPGASALRARGQDLLQPVIYWQPGALKTRVVAAAVLAAFSTMALALLALWLRNLPDYHDFFATWSFARFALTHTPSQIYDPAFLATFQLELKPDFTGQGPYPYPPTYLLAILPFGLLPLPLAFTLWLVAGLVAFAIAVRPYVRSLPDALLLIAAPATVTAFIPAQNGFFSGALMIGGIRMLGARPVLSGVLFGVLSAKPHLGLLIPIALAATRAWAAFAAAAITTGLLGVTAALAFGADIWGSWPAALHEHWDIYVLQSARVAKMMLSVAPQLSQLGVGRGTALAAQAATTLFAAVGIWACFRHGERKLAGAALLAGSAIASPYALTYDVPALTVAALIFIHARLDGGEPFRLDEVAILLLGLLAPYLTGQMLPVSAVALLLLFGLMVRASLRSSPEPAPVRDALAVAAQEAT